VEQIIFHTPLFQVIVSLNVTLQEKLPTFMASADEVPRLIVQRNKSFVGGMQNLLQRQVSWKEHGKWRQW
jgi:hypothetical protein